MSFRDTTTLPQIILWHRRTTTRVISLANLAEIRRLSVLVEKKGCPASSPAAFLNLDTRQAFSWRDPETLPSPLPQWREHVSRSFRSGIRSSQRVDLKWEYLDRKTQASEPNQTTFRPKGSRQNLLIAYSSVCVQNDLFPLACSCRQLSNAERKRHQGLYQMWLLGLTLLEFWVLH